VQKRSQNCLGLHWMWCFHMFKWASWRKLLETVPLHHVNAVIFRLCSQKNNDFFILRLSCLSVPYTGCPYTGHDLWGQRVN
jgi:hypothetical protein